MHVADTIDSLVAQHGALDKNATRERAILEKRLWETALLSLEDRARGERRSWLSAKLGTFEHVIEDNSSLLAFGDVAAPLWARTTADMTVNTAIGLMRKVRMRATVDECTVEEAVVRVIADYDALPNVMRLPGQEGKLVRKRSAARMPREPEAVVTSRKKKKAPESGEARDFRSGLRSMVSDHFRLHLHGLDSMAVEMAWRALEVDLNVVLDSHMSRLDRLRRGHAERGAMASRGKIVAAYRALRLEPPKPNEPIEIKPVKSQYKKLASIYHPDKSGTEETRPLYEAVVESYQIIEEIFENQNGGADSHGR